VVRVVPQKPARSEQWNRFKVVDRIVQFSKSCRTRGKVNLRTLIEEGKLYRHERVRKRRRA